MRDNQTFIKIQNCTKTFNDLAAVNNISLEIEKGKCVALLGPNGAGKTTLVEMIENVQIPDSGTIEIDGKNWQNNSAYLKNILGVSLQENNFFEKLTVYETILMFATLYNKRDTQRVQSLIKRMNLEKKANNYIPQLSGGQKQKLALAIALINSPKLIILDEPTTGLDPRSRKEIWDILNQLKAEGVTIILTTHYMEEAEQLCDMIYIMNEGKILTYGTLEHLLEKHIPFQKIFFYSSKEFPKTMLTKIPELVDFEVNQEDNQHFLYSLLVKKMENPLQEILQIAQREKVQIYDLQYKTSNLNDLFLQLAGRGLS